MSTLFSEAIACARQGDKASATRLLEQIDAQGELKQPANQALARAIRKIYDLQHDETASSGNSADNNAAGAQFLVYYHNYGRLKKEFPDLDAYDNFTFTNLDSLDITDELRFEELDERNNRAAYSEYFGILQAREEDVTGEMVGVFTYSVPYKSRRYHNNNDMNMREFKFDQLVDRQWDPDCLYCASILPTKLPWTQQFDAVLDEYFLEKGIDVSGIKYMPYFSTAIMRRSVFFEVQRDLMDFFLWTKEKYRLGFGAAAHIDNTFGDNMSVRHNVGDYGGLLEKAFGYFCAMRYDFKQFRRLGETLGCPNTPFHTDCDLKPEKQKEGNFDFTSGICKHLLDMGVLPSDQDDVLITYTTFGYKSITDNLIGSMKQVNMDHLLIVVCLDEKTLEYYRQRGQPAVFLGGFDNFDRVDFYESGWDSLMLAKQVAIWMFLAAKRNVIYIDGDIFIRKHFLDNLRIMSRNHHIAYQSDENRFIDYTGVAPDMIRYCAGFGYIKSTPETVKLYETYNVDLATYQEDQTYINKMINRKNVEVMQLPCEYYPNGSYWFRHGDKIADEAFIVHFNWDKPFFDATKEEVMQHFSMWVGAEPRPEITRKTPDDIICRLKPPLLVNKNIEGMGNKILSLANTIELAYKYHTKVCLDWNEGRYPVYTFSKFLEVFIPEGGLWEGKHRVYEEMLDFCDEQRSNYPEAWSHDRLLGDIYEHTNVKLPESYMHKVMTEADIQEIQEFCGYDVSSVARVGEELDYPSFERLKYSFKGELTDIRAPIEELHEFERDSFHERFAGQNVIVSDFRYSDEVPKWVRTIQPTGVLKAEIVGRAAELPKPLCGMHIRLTDFHHSKKFSDDYEELYQRYLSAVREMGVKNVLICSDSAEPLEWFSNQEGLGVWYLDLARSQDGVSLHDHSRNDGYEGIRGALLEMGMLSKCNYLIRPRWSSFSAVSQYWGEMPDQNVILID